VTIGARRSLECSSGPATGSHGPTTQRWTRGGGNQLVLIGHEIGEIDGHFTIISAVCFFFHQT